MAPRLVLAGAGIALAAAVGGALQLSGDDAQHPPPGRNASTHVPSVASPGDGFEVTGAGPDRLRFAVIGDFGTGSEDEYDITSRMCRRWDNAAFPLVITTGDNVYPDGDPALFESTLFDPFDCLFDRGVRVHASLGNHDVTTDNGRPEIDEPAFGMRGRNYVVRRSGVRFVFADSNNLNRDRLARMLTSEDGDRWTVVAFHHPVYSSGSHHGSTPGLRPALPRLFGRKGVDVVFNGHDHIYSVSRPLRRIRYVVSGGGGAGLYGCETRWFTEVCRPAHHFLIVVAGREQLTVRAIPTSGPPFDVFRTYGH